MYTLISQKGLEITAEHGTEGPAFDPYAYEEYTIERDGRNKITAHLGLSVWIEVNGVRREFYGDTPHGELEQEVAWHTGFFLREWQKFAGKLERARWRRHRGHDVRSESGYPGESFTYCHTCNEVLDSHFNENAIM